jgi:hypothetical protein
MVHPRIDFADGQFQRRTYPRHFTHTLQDYIRAPQDFN